MKGKKFLLYTIMFVLMSVLAIGGVYSLGIKPNTNKIKYANAEEIPGFSEKYDGDIIFSAEKVYFAEDEGNRGKQLVYSGYRFNSIQNSKNETVYFGDNGLFPTEDYSNKYVIRNGQYVIVDDINSKSTQTIIDENGEPTETGSISFKEGVMLTLGGYYYYSDEDGDRRVVTTTQEHGADLEIVAIQARRNGERVDDIPGVRTYNSKYYDFVWFIDANSYTEGFYQLSISYMKEGGDLLTREFEFYLLLKSSYETPKEVNGENYSVAPKLEYAEPYKANTYYFLSGSTQYPTLTFDYTRYDFSYTFNSGDTQKKVQFEYDETNKNLLLHTTVYNQTTTSTYPINTTFGNTIITLMFTDAGEYNFNFSYAYYYQGVRLTIPKENLSVDSIKLNIYGYQLKYSKTGFLGADMTYLEITQNGTMFILVNGFTDSSTLAEGLTLGVNYKLKTVEGKTGSVITSKSAGFTADKELSKFTADDLPEGDEYQTTNQGGLWLTLNDDYYLSKITKDENTGNETVSVESYYYYSTNPIDENFVKDDAFKNRQNLTKVTTFTKTGYYLIQAKYSYKDSNGSTQSGTQYFAFRITSSTPKMSLYKTEETNISEVTVENKENFYSHQFTNKNVYATWAETDVFESKINGTLYYGLSNNIYPSEETLKAVANGRTNSNIGKVAYNSGDILTKSGSYLLVLELERTSTKTYSYFTIDKEAISGLEVYEVSTYMLDGSAVYSIKRSNDLSSYVTHTSKALIDVNFTLGWADKASGANITGSYKFTPFVKGDTVVDRKITQTIDGELYEYIVNDYVLGSTSKEINISKPVALNSALNVDDVLTNQGIYIFTLTDDAGNQLQYVVIVDRTESVISGTYWDKSWNEITYNSGDVVTSDVSIDWGTHKAIDISGINNEELSALVAGEFPENYYTNNKSNRTEFYSAFANVGGKRLLLVENSKTEISLLRDNNTNTYIITRSGEYQIRNENGYTSIGWDETANNLFINATASGMTIKLDENAKRSYSINLIGKNQILSAERTLFVVTINPDEANGEVYSTANEGGVFDTEVAEVGRSPALIESDYNTAQASNDGLFVFEWIPTDETNFRVTEVRYDYYQLLNQSALNGLSKDEIEGNPYYPYSYTTTDYILRTVDGFETISSYTNETRLINGVNTSVLRSNPINVGYETYYDSTGNLVSNRVTQTGLYIITRQLNNDESQEFSYAFFVDRNGIVGYSISSVKDKIVGQFIHAEMPYSEGQIYYDNFAKQGLKPNTTDYYDQNSDKTISINYEIYLETNKLPTQIKVPSGKYVSGNTENYEMIATSYNNLKLKLSVYFIDSYGLLSGTFSGTTIRLMDNVDAKGGYIAFNFGQGEAVTAYRNARYHNKGDGMLSLPGTYIFVVTDEVGHVLNAKNEVTDYNKFIFGVKLTKDAPKTDVYAYANINGVDSDKVYSANKELYTNQEFVDFDILVEDTTSYQAQLDINNIEILRVNNGVTSVWLRVNNGVVDTNGIIKDKSRIIGVDKDGKEATNVADIVKYVIKLDTGLEVVDNQIISFAEYQYAIKVQYILKNSGTEFYTYSTDAGTESFYYSIYNVYIDRTPNSVNLENILKDQETYFQTYENYLASENGLDSAEINSNFAYRSTASASDYYALSNTLYYNFVNAQNYDIASKSMYAISVDSNTTFSKDGLSRIYYRKLDFSSTLDADNRMGLLPICDTYFGNSSGFYTFTEQLTKYDLLSLSGYPNATNIKYIEFFNGGTYESGAYYEVVEKDLAGNLTQYVIYFEPSTVSDVQLTITGRVITDEGLSSITLDFDNDNIDNQATLIGINDLSISNIATEGNQYYGRFNVYLSNNLVKSIYINATSDISLVAIEIVDIIKTQGNYVINYTDIYNKTYTLYVDNYPSADYSLNYSTLERKVDVLGQSYIELNGVNTKIADNLYCYVKEVTLSYRISSGDVSVTYNAIFNNGYSILQGNDTAEVKLDKNIRDRIYLADNIEYTITLTDVFENKNNITLSTSDDYYSYKLELPSNSYSNNNISYTANEVVISYNNAHYKAIITIYGNDGEKLDITNTSDYYIEEKGTTYNTLTLMPDINTAVNYLGSLRRFKVEIKLKDAEDKDLAIQTYEIWIDTRATEFNVTNQNLVNRNEFSKSTLKYSEQDYSIDDLREPNLYDNLISETINITWTRLNSNYFNYRYELIEFVDSVSYKQLLQNSSATSYTIVPKEQTTGKYVLKVTITGKNNEWIATRIFTINMSTSVSGLYEIKDHDGNAYEYSSITNLNEVKTVFGTPSGTSTIYTQELAKALGFVKVDNGGDVDALEKAFSSYGYYTAIPMYISTTELSLHSNSDNGVSESHYSITKGNTTITLYHVWRSNYRTFVIIMKVADSNGDLFTSQGFVFNTSNSNSENLLQSSEGNYKTIYNANAEYYKLTFNSYNKNTSANILEKHNKIIIDIYYNGKFASRIVGDDKDGDGFDTIEFKNGGTYTLYVSDVAGNKQTFGTGSSRTEYFTLIVMKEMLFTINGEAPIKYAFYDKEVVLTINNTNSLTNTYNYEFNSITLEAYLNNSSQPYTGYVRNSYTYTFSDYGTYLIKMTANLRETGTKVYSQIVFTILNPNEARSALDFTSIYGYNIISVIDLSKSVEKDVTAEFISLLADKSNQEGNVTYNKLLTYERLAETLGVTTQGKLKFKVVYEVNDDMLLPARQAEFTFTVNNEVPTITCSIKAGGETTKAVTLQFNSAIIYDQLGECNLVINDVVVLRIDENSVNQITQVKLENVGKYYIQIVSDSGNVSTSFNFTIKEPLNVMSIILIVVIVAIVVGLVGTFIWLRTRMKVR